MAKVTPEESYAATTVIPREEFINDYWSYKAGEHVTILAPSQGGKTELSYALLKATASPALPEIIFVMKPRDPTVERLMKSGRYRRIAEWPPNRVAERLWRTKPDGYILWPPGDRDPDIENWKQGGVFRKTLRDLYDSKGNKIVFADELFSLEKELGLSSDINRIYTKGASTGFGLWAASQRPAWISQWAFSAPHLFIGQEPDKRARDRYSEISSGIDPDYIRGVVSQLKPFEFLYIRRSDRTVCIVGAS